MGALRTARRSMTSRSTRRWFVALVAFTTCLSPSISGSDDEACGQAALQRGHAIAGPGLTLGESAEFWDGLESGRECVELFVAGRRIAWVWAALQTDDALFVLQCRKLEWPGVETGPSRYGSVELEPARVVVASAGDVRLETIELPGASVVANPAYCGRHVAYWRMGPAGKVHATVVDLADARVVADTPLDLAHPASDFSAFFSSPDWRSAGEVVPLQMRICTKSRPAGEPPSGDARSYPGYPVRFIAKLIAAQVAMWVGR